jgi:hypothetical protein
MRPKIILICYLHQLFPDSNVSVMIFHISNNSNRTQIQLVPPYRRAIRSKTLRETAENTERYI